MHEIFRFFDRRGLNRFDMSDFMAALSELRLDISERVATIAMQALALDGFAVISYAEFRTFVSDPDIHSLELSIQYQLSKRLEQR